MFKTLRSLYLNDESIFQNMNFIVIIQTYELLFTILVKNLNKLNMIQVVIDRVVI